MRYSEVEFNELLDALADDLLNAGHHFRLHKNLKYSLGEYSREMNQCINFWRLTLNAHREVSILYLCRAYDTRDKGTLNLQQLLKIIKGNTELFDISKFRDRLPQKSQKPTPEQIDQDFKLVSNENHLVKKLTVLRGNFIAHRNLKKTLAEKDDPESLTWNEFEHLVKQGLEIFNKYRYMFDSSRHFPELIGEDHYKRVLQDIRLGREARIFAIKIPPQASQIKPEDVYDAGIKAIDFKRQISQGFYNY